jgi:hypothetical protein
MTFALKAFSRLRLYLGGAILTLLILTWCDLLSWRSSSGRAVTSYVADDFAGVRVRVSWAVGRPVSGDSDVLALTKLPPAAGYVTRWQALNFGMELGSEPTNIALLQNILTRRNLTPAELAIFARPRRFLSVMLPYWALCVGMLGCALPMIKLVMSRMMRLESIDADARPCPDCRYDLRATPRRCPECGWKGEADKGTQGRSSFS